MKNLIEQIKKLEGVKEVKQNGSVITVIPKDRYVKVETQKQWDFVAEQLGYIWYQNWFGLRNEPLSISLSEDLYSYNLEGAITFDQFLTENNLQNKWDEFNLELIDGEIYYSEDVGGDYWMIFRFKSKREGFDVNYYSLLNSRNEFEAYDWCKHTAYLRTCQPATKKQKKKLIKAEVKNGYFHELNK